MAWYNRSKGNPPENQNEERALWQFVGGDELAHSTTSGASVNEQTAMKQGVVFAAVTLIADGVAKLPPRAFYEDEQGNHQWTEVPRWIQQPHPEIRRYEVFHQLLVSAITWGDGYARIDRRPSDGQILGLRVLAPNRVSVRWNPDDAYSRQYQVDGSGPWYTSYEIFHLQGPTLPGEAAGMSVIRYAREAIGLGLTLEDYGARYFGQGAQARVVIEVPNDVSAEKAISIVRNFDRFHKGKNNWHRPAIVTGGAKLNIISVPPDDSQFLESRDFQGYEIARWFRVPPHRVGLVSKSTSWGSGLSEENLAYLQHTLSPWITRLQDALTAYTVGGQARGVRIELNTAELLRGTWETQVDKAVNLVTADIINRTEARAMLGYPSDGRDDFKPKQTPAVL